MWIIPYRKNWRRVSLFSSYVLRLASILNFSRYFTFLTECETPKACTILLRGPSKDTPKEIDRNLADAMSVARNVVFHPLLAPGGGATEIAITGSVGLHAKAKSVVGVEGWRYRAVADAMEVTRKLFCSSEILVPVNSSSFR
jgi:chaperonin GroEL (HSP60 family)